MTKLAIPLSILAIALAGCGAPAYRPAMNLQAAPIVPQSTGYHPGTGVVVTAMRAPAQLGSLNGGPATEPAVTGASPTPGGVAANDRPDQVVPGDSAGQRTRLAIKMDGTGETQYVDVDERGFTKGTRVELTPDGHIRKL